MRLLLYPFRSLALVAIFCLALAGCQWSPENFIESQGALDDAVAQLRAKIGPKARVLRIAIGPDLVAIEAQDPKNPRHVDRWRYARFVFDSVGFAQLLPPEPVELQLVNPDLEANLFNLDEVKFSQAATLIAAAIKRAGLEDQAAVAGMEIARSVYILPKPGNGDVQWRVHVASGRERAEIIADASGTIRRADLSGTRRADNLDLLTQTNLIPRAAADFRALVGAGAVLTKVEIDPKTVGFETTIKDTTLGKIMTGLPSVSVYTWDLNGLVRRLGHVDVSAAINRARPPAFGVDEVDWTLVGRLEKDALAKVAIPKARVTSVEVEKSVENFGAPALTWSARIVDPEGEVTTVFADVHGAISRVELPESRRPKPVWTESAVFAGALAKLTPQIGPEARIAEIAVDNSEGRVTLDDPSKGGQPATFNFTSAGLERTVTIFAPRDPKARFLLKEVGFLTKARLNALEAEAMKRFGNRKKLYLDSITIGAHPFARKLGARAIELRYRDTPQSSASSGWAWIVFDFNGRVYDLSGP